jgi:hypothetical protein
MSDKIFEALGKLDNVYREDYREAAAILDDILIRKSELGQQNEALMAQVAELMEFIKDKDWLDISFYDEAEALLSKTPQQSLDSLKSKVEEETIERCAGYAEFGTDNCWIAIKNMPRKYAKV